MEQRRRSLGENDLEPLSEGQAHPMHDDVESFGDSFLGTQRLEDSSSSGRTLIEGRNSRKGGNSIRVDPAPKLQPLETGAAELQMPYVRIERSEMTFLE